MLRGRMVPTVSQDLLDLLVPRETRALLVLVAPLATLDLAVRRATRETLVLLVCLVPLVIRGLRVSQVMLAQEVRQESVALSVPRVTLVRSVRLVAWV